MQVRVPLYKEESPGCFKAIKNIAIPRSAYDEVLYGKEAWVAEREPLPAGSVEAFSNSANTLITITKVLYAPVFSGSSATRRFEGVYIKCVE